MYFFKYTLCDRFKNNLLLLTSSGHDSYDYVPTYTAYELNSPPRKGRSANNNNNKSINLTSRSDSFFLHDPNKRAERTRLTSLFQTLQPKLITKSEEAKLDDEVEVDVSGK